MIRLVAIVAVMAIPGSGAAATSSLQLLDGAKLGFTVDALDPLRQQVLLQDEGPPTPPRSRASKSSRRPVEDNPAIPGLGSVLGYMISGGVVLAYGVVFTAYGLALRLPCAITPSSCSGLGALNTLGIIYSIGGGIMDVVGGVLLYFGNEKRIQRNEMRAAQVAFSYDPISRSARVSYVIQF